MSGPGSRGKTPEAPVRVEERGGVAVVTIDRPRANALSTELLGLLADAVASLRDRPPGALVLYGGERIFSAGADVAELADPARAPGLLDAFRAACDALAGFPRPTLAALSGHALGGGLELALACDLRVVAGDARLGQPEVLLGILPGAGGTQRLARLVGPARAKDLVLTGRVVGAEEALRMGIADRSCAPGEALDAALDAERAAMQAALATRDAAAGMASFLAEGPGKAVFRGE
ncbi:MAG: enoyl-CoA hydratase/isomerase family protein [Actinomycetota bacterium]|nr:enoyl-CoA hydratase/isomerase family protein [Actinomycetota bacterium]